MKLLIDDVIYILEIVREFFDLNLGEAGFVQHGPRQLFAPHRAESGSVFRQGYRHAVHAGQGVQQGANRMIDVLMNLTGCRDVLHQKRPIRVQGFCNFLQDAGWLHLVVDRIKRRDQFILLKSIERCYIPDFEPYIFQSCCSAAALPVAVASSGISKPANRVLGKAPAMRLSARPAPQPTSRTFLSDTGLIIGDIEPEAYIIAAKRWDNNYKRRVLICQKGGKKIEKLICKACNAEVHIRQHILTDFIIGAYAFQTSERKLVTNDKGYYSTYFPELKIISADS